jgi:hypothetical protein
LNTRRANKPARVDQWVARLLIAAEIVARLEGKVALLHDQAIARAPVEPRRSS